VCAVGEPGDVAAVAPVAALLRVSVTALEGSLLPRALGTAGLPVLLERPTGAGVQAWLRAAERIEQEGNPDVVLCDPGDDLAMVPALRSAAARPLVVDASPGRRGHRDAAALARAAAAVGADGVTIGVDGELDGLSSQLDAVAAAVGRRMAGRRIRYVGGQGAGRRAGDTSERWRRR